MRIVSAPVAGAAYPRGGIRSTLIHAVQLTERGEVQKVLCGKVKPSSILDDASQYNRFTVTCPTCKKRLPR